ncbi:MAG TPA: MBL fold metallo-hydrolase [Candidatus Faecivivens stercoripullorum]|uniref:MBL fold metallo-hydrolase n=1 Tax=Candidatus Faecivivens stercoripullorum TaxID=2840805 RepID=A0A9D1KQN9_9FIRM|nr:MBL fold metallo-hydrolase [Candidatus Faecivivens stercoripullorum]
MQITTPIVTMIARRSWCINEYGMDAMFLLEGAHKALLIDTGTGTFNVAELVRHLTGKPVMVVCTHGHVDHVGGIGFFDTVYLHEADFEAARTLSAESRKGYVRIMNSMSGGLFSVTEEDVVEFDRVPELKPLKEGDIIDLGGRKIVVYETPGHTPGGLSFLDVRERMIFTGDACNGNTLLSSSDRVKPRSGVDTLLATAEKLKSLEPYYDRNYNGHIGYAANLTCAPMPESINDDAIRVCKGILSGEIKGEPQEAPFGGSSNHAGYGAFGVRFDPAQIYEK